MSPHPTSPARVEYPKHEGPKIPKVDGWRIVVLPSGIVTLVNREGLNPLNHPNALARLEAWFEAAPVRQSFAFATEFMRLANFSWEGDRKFEALVASYLEVFASTKPPKDLVLRALFAGDQQELPLEADYSSGILMSNAEEQEVGAA